MEYVADEIRCGREQQHGLDGKITYKCDRDKLWHFAISKIDLCSYLWEGHINIQAHLVVRV